MSWQSSAQLLKRVFKWLNLGLLLPALLILMLLAAMLYTATGLRLSLGLAQQWLPGLSIEDSQGSWLGGNTLSNLQWQQDDNLITVSQFRLHINSRCLLQLKLCVEELSLQGLSVDLRSAVSEPSQDKTVNAGFWLAFPLSIKLLSLENANVNLDGHQLHWQHLAMKLDVWGNKIQLTKPLWQQVSLTLAAAETAAEKDTFAYQAPKLADFQLPFSIFVEQFNLEQFRLISADSEQQLAQLQFSLQWQGQKLNLTQFELSHALGTLQSHGGLSTSAAYPLDIETSVSITKGVLAGQQLALTTTGSLADLHITALATGPVQAELNARLDLLSADLTHQLQLSSNLVQWPLSAASADSATVISLSHSQLHLSGSIAQTDIYGGFNFSAPQAPDTKIEFSGQANYQSLELSKLQLTTLGGQISSALTLDWRHDLSWQSETQLHAIQPGLFWPDYSGNLNGELHHYGTVSQTGAWQLTVNEMDIYGTLRDYALQLQGELKIADRNGLGDYQFSSSALVLHHADNTLTLSGQVDQQWQLALQLNLADLSQTVHKAHGQLNGQFDVSGAWARPELRGTIIGSDLKLQQLQLKQLNLKTALWRDDAKVWHTDSQLDASGGRYQHQVLDKLAVRLNGNEQQHKLSLAVNAAEHSAQLTLSGSLQQAMWHASLQDTMFSSLLGQWQLTTPTSLQYDTQQQRLSIDPHCWQQHNSQLCAAKELIISPQQLSATLLLSQFELNNLQAVMPHDTRLSGSLDATLTANWQQGLPTSATFTVSSKAGAVTRQLAAPLTLAWETFELNSTLSDNLLQNSLQINVNKHSALSAHIDVSNFEHDDKTLAGHISLRQFSIDFLQPLLSEFSELTGVLTADLSLSGSLQNPLLDGSAALRDTRVKGKLAPVDIDNANILLTFAGKTANLDGQLRTPNGEIILNGEAKWQQMQQWQAQLNIKGDALRLQVPQARVQIAPDLVLTANPQRTNISGSIHIPSANIVIDSLPASAVEVSDDQVLLDNQLQPLPDTKIPAFALETDINVIIGNRVNLSAFGLKTRLAGSLRVRQQAEQPLKVNGDVNLVDGTFRAYGQDLLIRKGKMNFNGPADQPYLSVEAIRNPANMEDDVIAGIRVNGPADDPTVVVFSEPAKAQANALAYLLMGRDLDSSSGNAGNAVTTSLIGMTLSSSSKLVGEIGEAFGLRDLTLDTAGAGEKSQVTVSGYISRDLQLKYGYGIFNAVGEFTLRYRVMRRLYLEAVSGVNNAVDLLYKFEFD